MSDEPIRIAASFAPQPFRLLAQNAPMVWTHGKLRIQLAQESINIDMCENLLKEQAPIIYADDLVKMAKVDGRTVVDIMQMSKVPMAMPAYDQMVIEADMRDAVRQVHQDANIESGVSLLSLAGYVKLSPFSKETTETLRYLIKIHARKGRSELTDEKLKEHDIEGAGSKEVHFKDVFEIEKLINVPGFIFRGGMIDEDCIDIIDTAQFVGIYTYVLVPEHQKTQDPGECIGPIGISVYLVDPNKGLVKTTAGRPYHFMLMPHESDNETYLVDNIDGFIDDCVETTTAICLQTMAMLNCSNVELIVTGQTTDGVSKKKQKQMRMRSLRHHELRVKVGKELIRISGRKGLTGAKGLGMVRGHFKDFSKGKGLFGRLKYPAVWVPPHARGAAENGVIMKDYKIDASETDKTTDATFLV